MERPSTAEAVVNALVLAAALVSLVAPDDGTWRSIGLALWGLAVVAGILFFGRIAWRMAHGETWNAAWRREPH